MEATAAALRLEEMTAVLESQQRELEMLRASARRVPSANEQQHLYQPEESQRETPLGEKNAPRASRLVRTCFDDCASAAREGPRSGNLESDRKENGRAGHSTGGFVAGCSYTTADGNSMADGGNDGRRAPVPDAEEGSSPAEQARAPVSVRGCSAEDFDKADLAEEGDPAPEVKRDDADHQRHSGISFNAYPTMTMATMLGPEKPTPPLGVQRQGEGTGEGDGGGEAEAPAEDLLPVLTQARKLEREGDPLPTNETELETELGDNKRVCEVGACCVYKERQDETTGDAGSRRTRAEAEALVRARRRGEESREWKKEATRLRMERRDLFRRLRMLGREAEEKVRDWSAWCHNSRAFPHVDGFKTQNTQ